MKRLHGEQDDENEMIKRERYLTLRVVKNRTGCRGEINLRYMLDCQKMVEILNVS